MIKNGNGFDKIHISELAGSAPDNIVLHQAWRAFIRYCAELQHGEMERLKIHDGLPVLAEVVKEKIKFTR